MCPLCCNNSIFLKQKNTCPLSLSLTVSNFSLFIYFLPFGHLDLTLYAPILPILFSFINEFIPLSSFVRSVIHCPSATGLAIAAALVPPLT